MKIITLDFETYYDKQYGLKKLTTEEYIRHELFETIGVSVKIDDGATVWYSGSHDEIKHSLSKYDWDNSFVLAHNMRFDGAILSWHYDIHPKGLFDTMGMAQILYGLTQSVSLANLSTLFGVGTKGTEVGDAIGKHLADFTEQELADYASYCINDVELTYDLFLRLKDRMTATEMRLIDLTLKMFTEPKITINKGLLIRHLSEVRRNKEELIASIDADKEMLMSNPKFAELLEANGVSPPMKVSPITKKQAYAFAKTDEEFIELLEHENPIVQALVAARLGNKSTIEETRTENFINIANRGALPVPLKYAGAMVTHRWSGSEKINLQNLPRSSPLRTAMCAPKGMKIVVADLSNIELRLAYWFANSEKKIEAIRNKIDLYKQSATEITGVPYDEVDKDLRFTFKVINLSGIYGVGPPKMQSILKSGGVVKELDEVKGMVYTFRDQNPDLTNAWDDAGTMIESVFDRSNYSMGRNDCITTYFGDGNLDGMLKPNGMVLGLPNLRKIQNDDGRDAWVYDKKLGRGTGTEFIHPAKNFQRCIQSLARDIIGDQLIDVAKRYDVVLQVHDELVMLCSENEVDECVKYVEKCMTTAPAWCYDLPLGCEIGVGDNYGEAK